MPEFEEQLAKEFDNMRGRVLGLIEAGNLPSVQERALKTLYKTLTYDAQERLRALYSTEQGHS